MAHIPDLESIRKNQIIDAALMTIAKQGYANVTMEDISHAAGLSKGGLAHYFQSKEDLFKATFQVFFQRIFARGEETMSRCNNTFDKLISFGWLYDHDDQDVQTGYLILFDFMSIAVRNREYKEIFANWVNAWLDLLKKAIIEGQTQGLYTNVDPEYAARSISAIYHGIAIRWFLAQESHSVNWAIDSICRSVKGLLDSFDKRPLHGKKIQKRGQHISESINRRNL